MPRKRKQKIVQRKSIETVKNENSLSVNQAIRGKKLVAMCVPETSKNSTGENDVPVFESTHNSTNSDSTDVSSKTVCEVAQRVLVDIHLNPERLTIQDVLDSKNMEKNSTSSEKKCSVVENQVMTLNNMNKNCIVEESPDNSLDIIENSPSQVKPDKNNTGPSYSPETLKVLTSKKMCIKRIQSITYDLNDEDDYDHEAQTSKKNVSDNNTPHVPITHKNNENFRNPPNTPKNSSFVSLPGEFISSRLFSPETLKKMATKACLELLNDVQKDLSSTTIESNKKHLEEEVTNHFDAIMMHEDVPSTSKGRNISLENEYNLSDDSVADPDWENPETDNNRKQKKIKTSRWHKKKEETYDRNKQKHLRSQCLPYKDYKKRLQPPKAPVEINCKCKNQCSENFTQEEREELCKTYWNLESYTRQKDFLLLNITAKLPKRILVAAKKRRSIVRSYSFTLRNKTYKVCEPFFKATLRISNGPINKAFSQIGSAGTFEGQDLRGKHEAYNKTNHSDEMYVKQHIESFPTVESHYCRKTSSKLYLQSDLSISKMYQLYTEKCDDDSKAPVSINVYRRIFCTQYNLDFHKPKKDQCLLCNKYKTATDENSPDLDSWKQKYDEHIQLRDQSQAAKEDDKKRANEDEHFNSITIDLQKVLHIPSSQVSLLYYLRKLNVYNATIYEAKSPNDGYCFLWTELDGKKGSDEVATAIYFWIQRLPRTVTEISIFSDTCAAQNRNQYLVCLLLYLVQKTNLQIIEHKYLESGHSHMEVDSIHSAIEHQVSKMSIFSITDLCNVIKLARSNRNTKKGSVTKKPYVPILMDHTDILDVKDLTNNLMKNRKKGSDGDIIQWLKVKCFKFEKSRPNIVQYKYDYTSEYNQFDVTVNENKNLRKRKQKAEKPFDYESYALKKAYGQKLPITKSKKKDLLKMCSEKIIPSELHHWYENLPVKDGPDYISDEEEDLEM